MQIFRKGISEPFGQLCGDSAVALALRRIYCYEPGPSIKVAKNPKKVQFREETAVFASNAK